MKTFDQFITEYNGKAVDTDGAFGAQCMDLMHKYKYEVLGNIDAQVLAAPRARTVFENFPNIKGNELFTRIYNTPMGIPQKGDIFFFGTGVGPDGHVCIFIDGNVNYFRSFDQNWAGRRYCQIVTHNYYGALGWLRFKNTQLTDAQKINAITVVMQSNKTPQQKEIEVKKILGL